MRKEDRPRVYADFVTRMNADEESKEHRAKSQEQEKENHGGTETRRGITTNYTNCHELGSL